MFVSFIFSLLLAATSASAFSTPQFGPSSNDVSPLNECLNWSKRKGIINQQLIEYSACYPSSRGPGFIRAMISKWESLNPLVTMDALHSPEKSDLHYVKACYQSVFQNEKFSLESNVRCVLTFQDIFAEQNTESISPQMSSYFTPNFYWQVDARPAHSVAIKPFKKPQIAPHGAGEVKYRGADLSNPCIFKSNNCSSSEPEQALN